MKLEKVLLLILLCLLLGLMAYYWRLGKSIPASTKATAANYTSAIEQRTPGAWSLELASPALALPYRRRT